MDKIIQCAEMIKELEYPVDPYMKVAEEKGITREEAKQREFEFEDERISGSSHGVTFKTKDGEYYTVMDQRA